MAGTMVDRMVGASFLSVETFEEVEHDQDATVQAAGVVAMVAVASALGSSPLGVVKAVQAAVGDMESLDPADRTPVPRGNPRRSRRDPGGVVAQAT